MMMRGAGPMGIGDARQITEVGVLSQAADDHDSQLEYGQQERPRRVSAVDRQPHLGLLATVPNRLHEPRQ